MSIKRELLARLFLAAILVAACAAPDHWVSDLTRRAVAAAEGKTGALAAADIQTAEIAALLDAYRLAKFGWIETDERPWPPLTEQDADFRDPLTKAVRLLQVLRACSKDGLARAEEMRRQSMCSPPGCLAAAKSLQCVPPAKVRLRVDALIDEAMAAAVVK